MKTRKRYSHTFTFILGVITTLCAIFIFTNFYYQQESIQENSDYNFPQEYRIISPPLPLKAHFAGEIVPINNFEVKERLEREFIVNTYYHSYTILAIKRANRWFPVIEPILKKHNIPDDFKYLCVAESNLDNVISPAKATGFWQFMEETGKKYGLEINNLIDERYHVEKSTEAACKYLKDAYYRFGSWTLAAASYNMGMGGTSRQLERQKAENYYNLVLNPETSRYISRIISLKYIMQNPEFYGFDIKENELYPPFEYKEIPLNTSVTDLADYAATFGINYITLKLYNPWMRDNYLTLTGNKTYNIKIPLEGSIEIIE